MGPTAVYIDGGYVDKVLYHEHNNVRIDDISPIKSGPQPIVTAQGRIRSPMPIVLPLSAIGRSHLGNPGLVASARLDR